MRQVGTCTDIVTMYGGFHQGTGLSWVPLCDYLLEPLHTHGDSERVHRRKPLLPQTPAGGRRPMMKLIIAMMTNRTNSA